MKLVLRPHQNQIVNELRNEWKQHRTHLVYGCVGLGKTAIAAAITNGFVSRGLRVLFVAPYVTLVEQTADRFMEYGLPQPSIIWQRHEWHDPSNLIQIASADTLIRREFPKVDLMIIDEAHIKRAKLLEVIENCHFPVIGLTGTPFTKWLGKYYSNFVKVTTMKQMIADGFLSDYDIYAPTKPDLKGVKTRQTIHGADYDEAQLAEIMGGAQIVGDIVDNWLKNGNDEPTIAFCVNVLHANHVTNQFNACGVNAEVMTAETPKEDRLLIIKRFEDGITKVICNVGVLIAGFDSDVRCIIHARPSKSEILWIQTLGRGLRTAKGKERCIIFDHGGTVHRLGMPCDIEYDELPNDEPDEEGKRKAKEKEKKEKLPKECGKCAYMKPAGVYACPRCGYKPLYGENGEVDETRTLEIVSRKKREFQIPEKQKFYSMLIAYEMMKGYKKGWAYYKYKEKFGDFPSKRLSTSTLSPDMSVLNWIKSTNIKAAKAKAKSLARNKS